jgi:hypothetical protein
MDVGRRMNARSTILTHFSQRYPKMPPPPQQQQATELPLALEGASEASLRDAIGTAKEQQRGGGNGMIAYPASDLMSLPITAIPTLLPSLLPMLEVALEEAPAAVVGGQAMEWDE